MNAPLALIAPAAWFVKPEADAGSAAAAREAASMGARASVRTRFKMLSF
jgi:hypothetical protein